ncbi:hypothetical protein [Phascolarctobacterium sp.]|uniref:hypothetical protein n=1 Tax=Phascolarctobacterium sp. TaxID=2049039 RepID=UPI0038704C5C
MAKKQKEEKIHWHPPFCSATELEFREDADILEFNPEYKLSKEPLSIDLCIIKKLDGRVLRNEIGKIFRKYNIWEYKSPGDNLTIDDFYKVLSYAGLYKSIGRKTNEIPATEITVSLVQEAFPRELFKRLKEENAIIGESAPGIFQIRGSYPFPIQIIVSKNLRPSEHSPLRILSKNVDKEDVKLLLNSIFKLTNKREKYNFEVLVNICSSANPIQFNELCKEDENMAGILEIAKNQGKAEANISTATDMIKDGLPASMIIKYSKLSLEKLQELAKSLNTTLVM